MENKFFAVGGTISPLSASVGGSSSLRDIAPVLSTFLDFFPAVIRLHCETRWNDEVVACGLPELSGAMVAQTLPYDPLPLAAENAWQFPLLCVYPKETTYGQRTTTWYDNKRTYELLYIFPPLSSEQTERLYPFLMHVENVLQDRIYEGLDQDFEGGREVWRDCGLEEISTVRGFFGKLPGLSTNLNMHCFSMEIAVTERRNPVTDPTNFLPYGGLLSGSIDFVSGSGDGGDVTGPITDFIVVRQDF